MTDQEGLVSYFFLASARRNRISPGTFPLELEEGGQAGVHRGGKARGLDAHILVSRGKEGQGSRLILRNKIKQQHV